jgi:hypothetical protein
MSSLAPANAHPFVSSEKLPAAELNAFVPKLSRGVPAFPVYYMRGGTSTGIVLWYKHVPEEKAPKEELIRAIMGVPAAG